jgi:hypothetical protein
MPDKRKEGRMSPRTGRPTDNPRPNKLSIRISDEDKRILENYCEENNVNRTEAISRGIKRLKEK